VLEVDRRPGWAWLVRPQAWTAAALTVALGVGIGLSMHQASVRLVSMRQDHRLAVQQQVAQVQPAAAVSPAMLKADNELLSAIDGELRADESTPASVYGLTTAAHGVRNKSAKRMSN
jgi:hypothetical protein